MTHLEATLPPAPAGPAVQHLSVDGAMVPLVGGEWAEVKTLTIGTVTSRPDADGTPHAHTGDLSYFSRLTDADTFRRLATLETHRRGTETAGVVCAVMDGAEWLQGVIDLHRPDAVRILDFAHAAQHLSDAAQAVFGAGSAAARTWLADQCHELKQGDPDHVIAAVAALPVAAAADPQTAVASRDAVQGYLCARRPQLDYARFQAAGYPIGSGCAESVNKLVIEARCKGSGMHWARANVSPMVALRAIVCGDRWEATWPSICGQLRQQARDQRRQRFQRRHLPPPAPPAPPAPPRPPRMVAGRPTARHPWKRPVCHGGALHNLRRAKP